jgi:hypothetical protein
MGDREVSTVARSGSRLSVASRYAEISCLGYSAGYGATLDDKRAVKHTTNQKSAPLASRLGFRLSFMILNDHFFFVGFVDDSRNQLRALERYQIRPICNY